MTYFKDMLDRLIGARGWIAAQLLGIAVLVLLGLGWTRLPDKSGWQVALTILLPLGLLALALLLQAGTMRALLAEDRGNSRLAWGTLSLLFWIALGWLAWLLLDWCDDNIPNWAGYLNSRASAHWRATLFTYVHLVRWLTLAEWILRWIVAPGKLIPCALASIQSGWRLPWRSVIRFILNWKWWPAVIVAALLGVALPGRFFNGVPHGTVSQQVWAVVLKLIGAYLLQVGSWLMLLGWAATLFHVARSSRSGPQDDSDEPLNEPALIGPPGGGKSASVRLPLPEVDNNVGGNA